ncbi:MAG: polysaccharide deacetylase family protein [Candidatus Melainabacteria bacterium]|nr:polysaccharide deacetylase family protein [Candidatus Melainabacteria bacterium]
MSDQHKSDFLDHYTHAKMEMLTWLGKRILPQGQWAGHEEHNETPRLYLTYDDGPHPETTPQLIELLAKENISATFFLIGSHVEKHPELVKQLAQAGHVIANHTQHHEFMPMLTSHRIEKEIEKANEEIFKACGQTPTLFRAPYGVLDNRVADCLKERGMQPVYWSCVSEDWMPLGPNRVVSRISRKAHDGALIVLHEKWFPNQTLEATRGIIKFARQAGYSFEALRTAV